jgi:hypothetical protein
VQSSIAIYFFFSCLTTISFFWGNNYHFFCFQKPGGIMALLDEAWWVYILCFHYDMPLWSNNWPWYLMEKTKKNYILALVRLFYIWCIPMSFIFHFQLNWTHNVNIQIANIYTLSLSKQMTHIVGSIFITYNSFSLTQKTFLTLFFCCPLSISMFPKSTHETFSQKLYEKFKNHKRFTKPKLSRTAFMIQHYAGDVSISHYLFILWCSCGHHSTFSFSRWHISLIISWTKTKTMW